MTVQLSWLRKTAHALPGVAIAGWLACSSWQINAQESAHNPPVNKAYLNKATFTLPILIDARHRHQLHSVQLYVKEGPTQPWKLCDKAVPTQTSFTYRAAQDGEYSFNIVAIDPTGRMTPADLTKEPPALIVVLDTQAPQINVQPLHSGPEGQYVRCECRDLHLDAFKSRLFYQSGDQMWRALDPMPGKGDTFCIPAQAGWTGNVRAVAADMAGNTASREINLAAVASAAPTPLTRADLPAPTPTLPTSVEQPAYVAPSVLPAPLPAVQQVQAAPVPNPARARPAEFPEILAPSLPAAMEGKAASNPLPPALGSRLNSDQTAPLEVTSQKITAPPAPQLFDPVLAGKLPAVAASSLDVKAVTSTTREPPTIQRQFSNATRLCLDYRIEALGASGVGKVEVWYTRDLGQSWRKLCEDSDRQSPVEINLPGDGIYGISLVITNGRGFGGAPPNPGDAPESWIEVDTIKPAAELVQIRPGSGDDSGALQINWAARDKNLAADSVELQYATARDGPWQSIAKGLKSEGVYRWIAPVEVGPHAFIRLTVRDQAGNVANAETAQPVPLDDASRPRGRVLGITAVAPRTNNSLPNP